MNLHASAPSDIFLPAFLRNPTLRLMAPRLRLIGVICGYVALANLIALALALWCADWLAAAMFFVLLALAVEYWSGSSVLLLCGSYVRMFKRCWIRKLLLAVPLVLGVVWLNIHPEYSPYTRWIVGGLTGISSVLLLLPTIEWKGLTDPFLTKGVPDRHPSPGE